MARGVFFEEPVALFLGSSCGCGRGVDVQTPSAIGSCISRKVLVSERHSSVQNTVCLEGLWEGRIVAMPVSSCTAIARSTTCLACADSHIVEDLLRGSLHGGLELFLGAIFRGCIMHLRL